MKQTKTQTLGLWVIILGVIGLIAAISINFIQPVKELDNGAIPACSFFFIMLGVAFCFPEMLQDETKALSTMRVVVFMVVSVFCIITVKLGWTMSSFEQFTIDKAWIYILGLAFGSKVFQSFSENSK